MKRSVLLVCCLVLMTSGCTALKPYAWENGRLLEPVAVFPSFSNNYLLSCLSDMDTLGREEFEAKFETARANLKSGRDLDRLRFICLSLNEKADDKQFAQGKDALEKYLEDHPELKEDMHGFRLLVDRIDEEIMNRWSAWKSLLNDKKELAAEVESLKIKVEEQQKQIEQLKNIEPIVKGRETGKP